MYIPKSAINSLDSDKSISSYPEAHSEDYFVFQSHIQIAKHGSGGLGFRWALQINQHCNLVNLVCN